MFKKFSVYFLLYLLTLSIIASVFVWAPTTDTHVPILRLVIICFATVLLIKYFVYMVVSPWSRVFIAMKEAARRKKRLHLPYHPKVSVLVPAWNEENGVITTLETLLKSTYLNTEIIVINNASTDRTAEHLETFVQRYTRSVRTHSPHIELVSIEEKTQGKGHALNKGVEAATGEIILSIDADCSVAPSTIEHFVHCFEDPTVMGAVGNVRVGNTTFLLGVVQYLEFLFSFYFKKCDSVFGSIYIIGGAAGAFRKEVLTKLHGYNTASITEDIDLSFRMQALGMKILYAHHAIVYTEGATDLGGLIKQRTRWKRGRFETFFTYRSLFFSREKKHNKILSWIILPLALFGEMQLFLESFFILFLFLYSYLTRDYSSFISGIIVVSSMFIVQIAAEERNQDRGSLFALAPIGWVLLYASTLVELAALCNTLIGYALGKEVKWQKWKRRGVFSASEQEASLPKEKS